MAQGITITVEPRTTIGKRVKVLRRNGLTPANIYGRGLESTAIQVDTRTLTRLLPRLGTSTLLQLEIGPRENRTVLVKDVHRHPLTGLPLHVDFFQVNMAQKLQAEVPLVFHGEAPAVKDGGVLVHSLQTVLVESLPGDLPASLEVDLSALTSSDSVLHVGDLKSGAGVHVLTSADEIVAKIEAPQLQVVEAEAAEEGSAE